MQKSTFWSRTGKYEGVIVEFCERKYKYYYGFKLNISFIISIQVCQEGATYPYTYIYIYICVYIYGNAIN